ncbi:MAG: hypothetical protein PUH10_02290 [Erysipelotrichaceae bacterium]|uniref:hypothetical protein n=1 Tax=Floccifex sp. TaxID=2815810 RepID=UPI002A74A4DF|nr:hypothetical protein [Floccifex sp.]MDD7280815.1 hypothetical protein [Erysipelotrichaceae bacterium]MDY2957965.1 hypothetical protein [Floccifex sp.]
MFVQLYCLERNEKAKNEIYEVLGLLCKREQIQIEDKGEIVEITVCPQGKITVTEQDDTVVLSATTRFAGPGFHAFVVEFFMDVEEEIEGKYELKDDLYYDGDFNALCSIYEDEIVYLKDLLLKNEDMQKQNYCYQQTFFLPMNDSKSIITPIGKIDKEEFRQMSPKELMPYFFIWNQWDKDAQYYKNAALYLLATQGAGKYTNMNETTEKYAKEICDFVELAYQQDANITLPVNEYNYICEQLDRKPKLENAKKMEQEVYQYRLKEVYHLFDNVRILANGLVERCFDVTSQSLCLSCPYEDETNWHWLIQVSKNDSICMHLNELEQTKPISYKGKDIQIHVYEEDGYYVLEAIVKQKENIYFHCVSQEESSIPYLTQCIKQSEFQIEMDE